MNRKVLLTISGTHRYEADAHVTETESGNREEEDLNTVTEAEYFLRNGTHYVIYEEWDEELKKTTKSKIKFRGNKLEMIRQGVLNTHMILEEGVKHTTFYQTPYGQMGLDVSTHLMKICDTEEEIRIDTEYTLEADGQYLSDCSMIIRIRNA